ncbi:hypothetical protein DFJ58DRAFT_847876 [Suillus subalutaceus]|uniref:uncharacterized protein n=1 Tax=Suillus subalutaceus TaxID=48586 RepID=UPI001B8630FA|nr:uncharacterized protein DFJ58DRAFT_847876 [Suillus subalutaceus]KAG1833235.1 hypothetical protein DFJ58DRAFT_847876 [Suillus subalutaceus]
MACGNVRNGTRLGICGVCKPVEYGPHTPDVNTATIECSRGTVSIQAPAFETINVLTLLSGVAAVDIQGGVQTSSMFSFNGVSYNQSTGGVLPAIEEYSGSSNPPGPDVGLAFYGGRVPVNTSFDWGNLASDAGTQGIAKNYTVTQQGVTANVTCQPIDRSQNEFNLNPHTTQGPEITFSRGKPLRIVQELQIQTHRSTIPLAAFFMSGLYKYDFLPTTVCEVVPYLTTVNVTYNGGIISVDRIDTSTSSPNFPLSQYIATVMAYQSGTNQGLTTNTIGDFLTAYGTSNVSVMYSELEDYWRGITEFASTQLRSGYSASGVPSNMTRSTSGTMYIMTYGWRSQAHTYIFLLVEITMIWSVTILAAGYSLIQEKIHASDPSFDFSDPVDLIIAASVGRLQSEFCEGDGNDVDNSEDITVRFEDVPDKVGRRIGKRLVTVIPEPLPETA